VRQIKQNSFILEDGKSHGEILNLIVGFDSNNPDDNGGNNSNDSGDNSSSDIATSTMAPVDSFT